MRVPLIPDVAEVLNLVTWREDFREYLRCLATIYVLTVPAFDIKSLRNCAHWRVMMFPLLSSSARFLEFLLDLETVEFERIDHAWAYNFLHDILLLYLISCRWPHSLPEAYVLLDRLQLRIQTTEVILVLRVCVVPCALGSIRQLQIFTYQFLIVHISIKIEFICIEFAIGELLLPHDMLFTLLPGELILWSIILQLWIRLQLTLIETVKVMLLYG